MDIELAPQLMVTPVFPLMVTLMAPLTDMLLAWLCMETACIAPIEKLPVEAL